MKNTENENNKVKDIKIPFIVALISLPDQMALFALETHAHDDLYLMRFDGCSRFHLTKISHWGLGRHVEIVGARKLH